MAGKPGTGSKRSIGSRGLPGKPRYILHICRHALSAVLDPEASLDTGLTPSSLPQGRHASRDELAASAYQAVEVDQQFGGAPLQVRVSMGKEPRHFMAIFKGKLVIYEVRTCRQSFILCSDARS